MLLISVWQPMQNRFLVQVVGAWLLAKRKNINDRLLGKAKFPIKFLISEID
jgi:hypothetical protein